MGSHHRRTPTGSRPALSVTVHSDNGAQFLAKTVREFLSENQLLQENTHPYIPEKTGTLSAFMPSSPLCWRAANLKTWNNWC
ncbi:MAG: hypothetical protein EPO28_08570 [Saprospiraceae bacterium]|nr:MAG: hypothetical protein EPO28_08570 [Saprospiraceae bacterium]